MKSLYKFSCLFYFAFVLINGCSTKIIQKEESGKNQNITVPHNNIPVEKIAEKKQPKLTFLGEKYIESFKIDSTNKNIEINYNRALSFLPMRDSLVKEIYSEVKSFYGDKYKDYHFSIRTMGIPVEDLIPNYFRENRSDYDTGRLPKHEERPVPLTQDISKQFTPSNGLFNRNIVVWQSHGWYYNNEEDRWEWQRPRIFQTVEDKLPLSFVVPYLLPMLENAGAIVFDPRERDFQKYSVVIDNDSPKDIKSKYYIEKDKDRKYRWLKGSSAGFAEGKPPYKSGYNPFEKGTYKYTYANSKATDSISWIPRIPEEGNYSVYISYHASSKNITDARYTVYHSGIKTEFKVNQQIGGGTWVYLGNFKFSKGYNPKTDKVVLNNKSDSQLSQAGKTQNLITADAVRFGGGMGVIERGGQASGRPKIFEAARYYMQYAGMPDSLVYDLNNNKNDYNDDYQGRPEYVNYLNGSPAGPNRDRNAKGLGIPIDLSLAFHTDAGITHNDTVVGTLSIYSLQDAKHKKVFPDGMSRLANRDLADIMQTQIVNDIRANYDQSWTRRHLENGNYSESRNPNVPSLLVELLSHQNFTDMKFAEDPQFRFDVARAMYKGMLRFIATQNNNKYVVEPLPVDHFMTSMDNSGNVRLNWHPVEDPLEPTAKPERYIVYTRINGGSFDNGKIFDKPFAEIKNIKPGNIYSYKVTAINSGGESFPSEILSVCRMNNDKKPVIIINGFYRVAGPAYIESPKFTGFLNENDPGIPDKYDLSFTGKEYDFDSTHQWITNDNPGWGASHADYESQVIAGNNFDYPYVHGLSIMKSGYSFVSASAQAVEDKSIDLSKYNFVDLIMGEQKSTHWETAKDDSLKGLRFKTFPLELQSAIEKYCQSGGNLFVSGAYIGSDLFNLEKVDSTDINFGRNTLHFSFGSDHACSSGNVFSANELFMPKFKSFTFNTHLNDKNYAVISPDELVHVKGSETILRYSDNQFSAGTAYKGKYGVIAFGFPFETIIDQAKRDEVMKDVLHYFGL